MVALYLYFFSSAARLKQMDLGFLWNLKLISRYQKSILRNNPGCKFLIHSEFITELEAHVQSVALTADSKEWREAVKKMLTRGTFPSHQEVPLLPDIVLSFMDLDITEFSRICVSTAQSTSSLLEATKVLRSRYKSVSFPVLLRILKLTKELL
jgi:hypothetical protein